jgi:hypothetical protein
MKSLYIAVGLFVSALVAPVGNAQVIKLIPPVRNTIWEAGSEVSLWVFTKDLKGTEVGIGLRTTVVQDDGTVLEVGWGVSSYIVPRDGAYQIVFSLPDNMPAGTYSLLVYSFATPVYRLEDDLIHITTLP